MLLPKEHGAYGQMAMPLVTALVVAGPSPMAGAIVAGFLAHEPLMVLLGTRGPRARREAGLSAPVWLGALAVAGTVAGFLALGQTPPALRWTYLLPLVPAVLLTREVWRGQPKSATAEVSAATAFSLAAVPMVASAGAPVTTGLSIALPFLVVFVAATLAVRAVTRRVRDGSDSPAGRPAGRPAVFTALAGTAALGWAAAVTALPWSACAAALPGAVLAAGVAVALPHPRHLKRLGWMIVGASLWAAGVLVATR